MKLVVLLSALIILLLVGYAGFMFFEPIENGGVSITINKGEAAAHIAKKLYNNKVIRSKIWFRVYLMLTDSENELKFGRYLFADSMSLIQVINKLKRGEVLLKDVTIPEGLTIRKTCKILSDENLGDYTKFVSLCSDSLLVKKLTGFSKPSLEGFLYPETYSFSDYDSEEFIISHLVKRFFKETSELDFVPNDVLDFYNTIVLASIVEKEAMRDDEKPLIADVYLNRIESGHKLQADPTVAYILELEGKHRSKIYYRDLEIDSPYNTYKYKDLPPTPICNPSVSAIKAVLEPADTDYFFFFANNKGRHIFSQTYSQHLSGLKKQRSK
jgi:UPF0755 protein